MTKIFFKVDTKKDDVIFNQDYIVINGCLMFHKTVACIGLDVELLQDKINNNIPFNYKDKNFISELPLCEKLLPENFIKNPGTYTEYKNTGLTQLKNNKKGNEIMENYFIIETKNAGLVMIRPDLFTCSKPYKYDLFTQKWVYEWVDKKEKIFTHRQVYDGKFKKNNIHAQDDIYFIKKFILSEYETTKE